MAGFKQKATIDRVEENYFQRVGVFLESKEDWLIVADRWFFDVGDKIRFEHADDGEGGGAHKVVDKVNEQRLLSEVAFGIVDRDAIKVSHPGIWWEDDDARFKSERPLGDSIRVLTRWEIENYLLDPDVIEEAVANMQARPIRQGTAALQTLTDEQDAAIALSAADIVASGHGQRFDHSLDRCPANSLPNQITTKLGQYANELVDTEVRVRDFASGHPRGSPAHWERLNRMLDGKRLLRRLNLAHGTMGPKDKRLELANNLRLRGRIPAEFIEYIDEFKAAALRSHAHPRN